VVELELLYRLIMSRLIAYAHSDSTFGTVMPFLVAVVLCRFRSRSSCVDPFSYSSELLVL